MSSDSAEKREGFERWVASLKLDTLRRQPLPEGEQGQLDPGNLDDQATLVKRLPKEVIYRLRQRESQRPLQGPLPSDDSTAIFVPPPELLVRAKRLDAPPKPSTSLLPPEPDVSAPHHAAVSPAIENEPTRIVRPDAAALLDGEPERPSEDELTHVLRHDDAPESARPVEAGPPSLDSEPASKPESLAPAAADEGEPSLEVRDSLGPTAGELPGERMDSFPPVHGGYGWLAFAAVLLIAVVVLVASVH